MLIYFLLPLIAVALLCVPFIFTAKKIRTEDRQRVLLSVISVHLQA